MTGELKSKSARYAFVPLFWVVMMVAFTVIAVCEAIHQSCQPFALWRDLCEWAGADRLH